MTHRLLLNLVAVALIAAPSSAWAAQLIIDTLGTPKIVQPGEIISLDFMIALDDGESLATFQWELDFSRNVTGQFAYRSVGELNDSPVPGLNLPWTLVSSALTHGFRGNPIMLHAASAPFDNITLENLANLGFMPDTRVRLGGLSVATTGIGEIVFDSVNAFVISPDGGPINLVDRPVTCGTGIFVGSMTGPSIGCGDILIASSVSGPPSLGLLLMVGAVLGLRRARQ